MFGNWLNAAMASYKLDTIEEKLKDAIRRSKEIFDALNRMQGVKVIALDNGTNIYDLQVPTPINVQKFGEHLAKEYLIRISRPNANGIARVTVNETLLYREPKYIIDAFKDALNKAK